MPDQSSRRTMDDYLAEVGRRGNFAQYFAPDVVWTTMETGEQVHGRDAVRDLIVLIHDQAFKADMQLSRLLTDDEGAMIEAVLVGRHVGDFAGVSATGTEVRISYTMGYDTSAGAITALRAYFPIAAVRDQLHKAAVSAGV